MAKSNETILIEACLNGDLDALRNLKEKKINLKNKSRAKGFSNLFDRAISSALSSKKNSKEVIELICILAGDSLNELLSEDMVITIANKYKFYALDCFIEYGWTFGTLSSDNNYKTIYDKLFRQSIVYARIELLEYLIDKIDLDWLDLTKLIPFMVNNEELMGLVESRLQDKVSGFTSIYSILNENGLDPMEVAAILS